MKLAGGDRQFVAILAAIPVDGAEAVTVACELALEASIISAEYVLNTLDRLKAAPSTPAVETPDPPAPHAGTASGHGALRPAAQGRHPDTGVLDPRPGSGGG